MVSSLPSAAAGAPAEGAKHDDAVALTRRISNESQEVYDTSQVDPILTRKMTLVNNAIDEIGMTTFHWKLFFLNGFGYAVDSVSQYIANFSLYILTLASSS